MGPDKTIVRLATGALVLLVVGIFSIVVVTTASLQNRAWESRLNSINERVIEQNNLIYDVFRRNEEVIEIKNSRRDWTNQKHS